MSDGELAVKYLGTTADHIDKYNKVVKCGRSAWCCCLVMGADTVLACLICCGMAGQLFGVLILLVGLVLCVVLGVVILKDN